MLNRVSDCKAEDGQTYRDVVLVQHTEQNGQERKPNPAYQDSGKRSLVYHYLLARPKHTGSEDVDSLKVIWKLHVADTGEIEKLQANSPGLASLEVVIDHSL